MRLINICSIHFLKILFILYSFLSPGFINLNKLCTLSKQILHSDSTLSLFSKALLMVCKLTFIISALHVECLKKTTTTLGSCCCFEMLLLWNMSWKIITNSHSLQIMNSQLHTTTCLLKGRGHQLLVNYANYYVKQKTYFAELLSK